MFIPKKDEQVLGIGEDYTHGWRRENLMHDSDGFVEIMEDQQKKKERDQIQFL
jgi:hypothetical protein